MLEDNPESYRNESKFGPIPGVRVGATWKYREDCAKARVHTSTTAGISGGKDGAYSIIMSGGYADDDDKGDEIIYTGTGGYEDSRYGAGGRSGAQVANQSFEHSHNSALVTSYQRGRPVRVIRGHNLNSKYSPCEGYRYDGLYKVTKVFTDKSNDGFEICRFKLKREPNQDPIPQRRI